MKLSPPRPRLRIAFVRRICRSGIHAGLANVRAFTFASERAVLAKDSAEVEAEIVKMETEFCAARGAGVAECAPVDGGGNAAEMVEEIAEQAGDTAQRLNAGAITSSPWRGRTWPARRRRRCDVRHGGGMPNAGRGGANSFGDGDSGLFGD